VQINVKTKKTEKEPESDVISNYRSLSTLYRVIFFASKEVLNWNCVKSEFSAILIEACQ
jgi:hypothetical protein